MTGLPAPTGRSERRYRSAERLQRVPQGAADVLEQLAAAGWAERYRLNSHLDLLSDQGVLPHLLTIALLRRSSRSSSYFLPGIDVWFSKDDTDRAEADIFGVLDGAVLSGEVKTSTSEFTFEQVARDVRLSTRLQADIHVMSATDVIPPDTVELAARLRAEAKVALVVLEKKELLPQG